MLSALEQRGYSANRPNKCVRIVIFDAALALIERARAVFSLAEVGLIFAGPLAELEVAVTNFGPHDLMF